MGLGCRPALAGDVDVHADRPADARLVGERRDHADERVRHALNRIDGLVRDGLSRERAGVVRAPPLGDVGLHVGCGHCISLDGGPATARGFVHEHCRVVGAANPDVERQAVDESSEGPREKLLVDLWVVAGHPAPGTGRINSRALLTSVSTCGDAGSARRDATTLQMAIGAALRTGDVSQRPVQANRTTWIQCPTPLFGADRARDVRGAGGCGSLARAAAADAGSFSPANPLGRRGQASAGRLR